MTQIIHLKLFPSVRILVYDVVATLAWTYAFLKLFVFDVDAWVILRISPQLSWLLDLRLFIFAAVVLVTLVAMGRTKFFLFVAYVVGFPFILIFWKLSFLVLRMNSWIPRLAVVNLILTAFTNIRYKLAYFVIYSLSTILIVYFVNPTSAAVGLAGLFCCVVASYAKTMWDAFRAPRVLALYKWAFGRVQEQNAKAGSTDPTDAENKLTVPVSNLPEASATKHVQRLQSQVFVNRICVFLATRLREYNRSEVHVLGGLASLAFLVFLTMITFGLLYRAAVVVEPGNFALSASLSPFDYIRISFDNMIFGSVGGAEPLLPLSQTISMLERLLSGALALIAITIIIETRRRRHSDEFESTITAAEDAAARVEGAVVKEFSYPSMDDAIRDLAQIETSLYVTIVKAMNSFRFK